MIEQKIHNGVNKAKNEACIHICKILRAAIDKEHEKADYIHKGYIEHRSETNFSHNISSPFNYTGNSSPFRDYQQK